LHYSYTIYINSLQTKITNGWCGEKNTAAKKTLSAKRTTVSNFANTPTTPHQHSTDHNDGDEEQRENDDYGDDDNDDGTSMMVSVSSFCCCHQRMRK